MIAESNPALMHSSKNIEFRLILDNGVKVMVPPFISQDEAIVVNTETMEYSERA